MRRYARLCALMSSHTVAFTALGATRAVCDDVDDILINGLCSVGSPSAGTRLELDGDEVASTMKDRDARCMPHRCRWAVCKAVPIKKKSLRYGYPVKL